MALEQAGHRLGVGHDAGDVGGGREGADLQRLWTGFDQRGFKRQEIGTAGGGFRDLDHVRAALPPGQNVRMMLVGADQHHRLPFRAPGLVDAEKRDEPVDPGRRARADEHGGKAIVGTAKPGDRGAGQRCAGA